MFRQDFSRADHRLRGAATAVLVGMSCGSAMAQPSLTPSGPPTSPSGRFGVRTEIKSLPYIVTIPGSYYLSASLSPAIAGDGITIMTSNVTIDLMGFTLAAAPGASNGIYVPPPPPGTEIKNIRVENGFVTGWGAAGVDLYNADNNHIFNVNATENGGDGIRVGNLSDLNDVIACCNLFNGVTTKERCKLSNCLACCNSMNGVVTVGNCHVDNTVAILNGFNGLALGLRAVVIGCVANDNSLSGVFVAGASRVTDCTADGNGFGSATGDKNGFTIAGGGNILGGCAAHNNFNNGFEGLPGPGGSSVGECIAVMNGFGSIPGGGNGFKDFRSVMQCTANNNFGNGIQTESGGHIVRNTCESNGFLGIAVFADGNVVENNNVVSNPAGGIAVGVGGNLVAANRAHANGLPQYSFAAGNTTGPIFGPGVLAAGAATNNVIY